jgi:type IV fimbrial biogenesis protein FimT
MAGTITSNRPYYEFRVGRRSTNGTVVFCDRRGTAAARSVIVSYTARPRVADRDADGRPLQCA